MSDASQPDQLSPVKRALLELREARSRIEVLEREKREPLAVIGMGCRFPGGVDDPESYWRLLQDGVDAIGEVPPGRWDIAAYYDPDPDAPGKMSTRYGGFLDTTRIETFDAPFFSISPREAASMDPQQRLLLEVSWEALENAGVAPDLLVGSRTGVFVGISTSDYFQLLSGDPATIDAYRATGNCHSVASGRLSYSLGLQGPSVSVDTACSSSLVAVHLACQSLRLGECRVALAGGVNLVLWPENNITLSKAHMMAPDGRCKTFDAAADGFVRGEGCGIVVLKRLSDAVADGDTVLAVIRGSAVNQDGRSSGLTAPNGPSQVAVIREALANAGVVPADVGYVEAHGTGTSLGDPIEVQALQAVLGEGRTPERRLRAGSVKTNLGHLEAAAGVAGLIKVVLALRNREIPPHLHLKTPSPHIPWSAMPVDVPTTRTPWEGPGRRIAGVSSFGFGGTNAHVVVEEADVPPAEAAVADRPLHVLTLSARTGAALRQVAARLEGHLARSSDPFADVCFTANVGRAHLAHRAAIVAPSAAAARETLALLAAGGEAPGARSGEVYETSPPEVAFLFTGQGSQYVGMGRELYETQPVFRKALERCDQLLRGVMERPLLEVMYGAAVEPSLLDETAYTQPALFALEYALCELWRSWGVEPTAVLGHSVGEYVAACVAGVFGLEDGLALIAERGRLMQALPRNGEMAAVFAPEADVATAIVSRKASLSIAAVNGPDNVVLSGEKAALAAVLADLGARGIRSKKLSVSHAFHSPLMDPMLAEFAKAAAKIQYHSPRIPLFSNLTGRLAQPGEMDRAEYWIRHVREAVRFEQSMAALAHEGATVFLEIGPTPTLLGMGRRGVSSESAQWLPSLRKGKNDSDTILGSLATLHVCGTPVDWAGFDQAYGRHKVALPTYPFQRERHWLEQAKEAPARSGDAWTSVVRAGRQQAQAGPLDLGIESYPRKWRSLDRLALALMVDALRGLSAFTRAGESRTVSALIEEVGLLPTYRNLMTRWLENLASEGLLVAGREGAFVSPRPLPEPPLEAAWTEATDALSDLGFMLDYLRRCAEKLGPVLTGRESPLETLFPGGSFETAEHLYHHWAVARYFNGIVASAVQAAVQASPSRDVHILEVGAGSGGTTGAVLPRLPSGVAEYVFTDTSEVFLARAQEKFADYPYLRFGLLDIEKSPTAQGYAPHGYDVVVAANVLHATRDLDETLGHVLGLLAPGGVLALYETTHHPHFFDVSFGLIEGWQRFADEKRGDNPLLDRAQWIEVLRARGFTDAAAFPEPGSPAEILIAGVVLARAPSAVVLADGAESAASPRQAISRPAAAVLGQAEEFRRKLGEALPSDRREMLVAFLGGEVARILRIDTGQPPDARHRLMDLGFDSLMAVEFRNRLIKALELQQSLPATLIFDFPTIDAMAEYLDTQVLAEPSGAAPAPAAPARPGPALSGAEIAELSEEDAEALLLRKLGSFAKK